MENRLNDVVEAIKCYCVVAKEDKLLEQFCYVRMLELSEQYRLLSKDYVGVKK